MPNTYQEKIKNGAEAIKEESETVEKNEQFLGEAPIKEPDKETSEKKTETESAREKKEKKETIDKTLEKEISSTPTVPPTAVAKKKAEKIKNLDQQSQIKALIDLSFKKGLDFAIEVANGLGNAYVLDEFHDALVDKLYKKLVEKKKLKVF